MTAVNVRVSFQQYFGLVATNLNLKKGLLSL